MWTSRVVGLPSNLPTCMREGTVREDLMTSPVGVVLCLACTLTAWQCHRNRIPPGHRGVSSPIPTGEHAVFPVVVFCDGGTRETPVTLCFFNTPSSPLHSATTLPPFRFLPSSNIICQIYLPELGIKLTYCSFLYRPRSKPWPLLSRPAICGPVSWPPPAA